MKNSVADTALASLVHILDRYTGLKVWVIGDLMLDEYLSGNVERISPEAPVPVVRMREVELRLGGAANVARQIATLGAHVTLAGVAGSDQAGDRLIALCEAANIDTHGVLRLSDRRTTRKLRILGHSQQLLRLDWEDAGPCAAHVCEDMVSRLKKCAQPDVIVLSDYAKGVLTSATIGAVMQARSSRAVPVLVDPKHRDFTRYRGATVITPNLHELGVASGRNLSAENLGDVAAVAREVAVTAEVESLVVTLGESGMLVVPAHGDETVIPANRRAVYDVTGAGDTAIAVLATSIAAQASIVAAAQIANAAAGLAVGQVGTTTVDRVSIRESLTNASVGKIVNRADLASKAASWRMAGKRIVFTNGCFDLLHAGHLSSLHEAAVLGDVLVVAINSDASVRRLKGSQRPFVPEAERCALLAALTCVDAVTVFDEDTPLETLRCVRPQVLVKGQDYRKDDVVGRHEVEADGGRVVLVPLLPEKSTTALLERMGVARS